jgi:hypothetical protein
MRKRIINQIILPSFLLLSVGITSCDLLSSGITEEEKNALVEGISKFSDANREAEVPEHYNAISGSQMGGLIESNCRKYFGDPGGFTQYFLYSNLELIPETLKMSSFDQWEDSTAFGKMKYIEANFEGKYLLKCNAGSRKPEIGGTEEIKLKGYVRIYSIAEGKPDYYLSKIEIDDYEGPKI